MPQKPRPANPRRWRPPARFIVLDGPDGCGKSTQARLLVRTLRARGLPVVLFRDPGGTRIGEAIRKVLLRRDHKEMAPRAELLLYMASRAQGVEEAIRPAFAAGKTVVSDRFDGSSIVYQGIAQRLGVRPVALIGKFATGGLRPDLTLILDLPVKEAARRMGKNLDRMEAKGLAFQEKVGAGFRRLCREFPREYRRVDARGTVEEVRLRVLEAAARG